MIRLLSTILCALSLAAFTACSKSEPGGTRKVHNDHDGHDHAGDDHAGHDHGQGTHEEGGAHGTQGPVIALGSSTIGDWTVRVSRNEGAIAAGSEAVIDVWLTGGTSEVVAVRFWIGTQDAAGSVKARAEIEDPAEPGRWHTHAEVPNPLPAGAKLWVELEIEGQVKKSASFDLKK